MVYATRSAFHTTSASKVAANATPAAARLQRQYLGPRKNKDKSRPRISSRSTGLSLGIKEEGKEKPEDN